MICTSTSKLLIFTWVAMALLIGVGIGYLLGVQGFGQKVQSFPVQQPMQQQNFGPGAGGVPPQQPPASQQGGQQPAGVQQGGPVLPNQGGQPVNPPPQR